MDRTAMDSICMSTYPIEQFIPQNEDTNNYEEKSIAEAEPQFDSADCCTQRVLIHDQDAGANAGLRSEFAFETNNSLSELVWSPRKGLSLKCADCSLTDRKSMLFRGPEPREAIASPPTNIKAWESENSIAVDSLRGSHQDMEPFVTTNRGFMDLNFDVDDQSAEKEDRSPSADVEKDMDLCEKRVIPATSLPIKDSFQDNKKCNVGLSNKPEDTEVDLQLAETSSEDCNKEKVFGSYQGIPEARGANTSKAFLANELVAECSKDKEHNLQGCSTSISRSPNGQNDNPNFFTEVTNNNRMVFYPNLMGNACGDQLESMAENDVKPSEAEAMLCCQHPHKSEVAMATPLDCNQTALRQTSTSKQRMGKEKALSDTEVNHMVLKGKDASQESSESCNRGVLLSEGKRARSFEQKLVGDNKRTKKRQLQNLRSISSMGEDSSFKHWIENMVKRFPKSGANNAPTLELTSLPHDISFKDSNKNKDLSFASSGFANAFQALFKPCLSLESKKMGSFKNHEGNIEPKETEVVDKISWDVNPLGHLDKETVKSLHLVAKFNEEPQVGEFKFQPTIASPNNTNALKQGYLGEFHNSSRFSCGAETNGFGSLPNCAGARDVSVDPNENLDSITNKSKQTGSLWITRLSLKLSKPVSNLGRPDEDKDADVALQPPKLITHVTDENNFAENHEPFDDNNRNDETRNANTQLVRPSASCGTKQTNLDVKFTSKLSPIVSCQGFNAQILQSDIIERTHCHHGANNIFDGERLKAKSESMLQTSPIRVQSNTSTTVPNKQVPNLKPIEKDFFEKTLDKRATTEGTSKAQLSIWKNTTLNSKSGSSGKQIPPLYNNINRKISDMPHKTFEAIRRLRLSRMDILKWTKSPISSFSLEGYFIRLRLGKWEEGLGGTGYHVACISGMSQKPTCEICKSPISVNIGGLKCLVDCRYVSNHDFIEDELMAWWFATLRDDGRAPSQEDLSLKLIERERYGF